MQFEEKKHILVIDDDDRIRSLLMRYLEKKGCVVMVAENADAAHEILKNFIFDILIIDVMMPEKNGFEFGKDVRSVSDVPILFLTAKSELSDKSEGFLVGADDYLVKPFEPEELLMRIDAILARRGLNIQAKNDVSIGGWVYSRKQGVLISRDKTVQLTDVERRLLDVMLSKTGQIFSREHLAQQLGMAGNDRTIDVQITRLRKKIENDPKSPRLIQTVRGKGYILHLEL